MPVPHKNPPIYIQNVFLQTLKKNPMLLSVYKGLMLYVVSETTFSSTLWSQSIGFIIIYYILSSNKGIFVWPIWPEVNCPFFSHPGKITGYWITTRSFPYRGPYWTGPMWASTSSQAIMGVSFLDVGSM